MVEESDHALLGVGGCTAAAIAAITFRQAGGAYRRQHRPSSSPWPPLGLAGRRIGLSRYGRQPRSGKRGRCNPGYGRPSLLESYATTTSPSRTRELSKRLIGGLKLTDNMCNLFSLHHLRAGPQVVKRERRPGFCSPRESFREHHAGLHSFRNMSLMEARRRKASALRVRFSQSLASLRHRPSQAKVRSTIQRFGRTTKPLT